MKKNLIIFILFLFFTNSLTADDDVKVIKEGNLNAKIKLIVYESLTCSHCANFHRDIYPKLKEDFIDKGYANIEFRNFPLDLASLNASKLAHCRNDGESDILHFLYKNQKKWLSGQTLEDLNKNLEQIVKEKNFGINYNDCINNKVIEDHILTDRINAVKKYEIEATPTLIINDKKFDNPQNYKKLKKKLEKMI
jgi:protein-disulfide isomerase|tara:strand:- start:9208 stop:9789 length:582 start_codon:yes stop_codon:yes gene_type:complete